MRERIRIKYIHHFKDMTYPSRWAARIDAVKDPDTDIEALDAPDSFVEFVEQTYESELMGVQFARDAWKQERRGDWDALCNACGAEPGVKAARELCETLVMGPACAAMHVASMLGRRFAYVIAGGEENGVSHAAETITSLAEQYGLAAKLASVRTVPVTPRGFREDLISDEDFESLRDRTVAEASKAVREDGADVIVSYGGPRLYDALVTRLRPLGVPVISPDLTLLKVTEMLVRLGLSQSKRRYPRPRRVYDFTLANATAVLGEDSLPA